MLHIYCPHCGEFREEEEFHVKGQAHIARPLDPDACTDEEWGEYLYFRKNPRGKHHVTRDTQTYEIEEVYLIGELPQQALQGAEK